MAGDWIKVEFATIDKPEVLEMAELLETSSDDVLGKLLRVWSWFDQQSTDGNAGGVTGNALKRFIDRLVGSQGFASCMEKVGWLNETGMPNFDNHNGKSAKNRAVTAKRVKQHRLSHGNAHVTLTPLPEKRREEVKEGEASTVWVEGLQLLVARGDTEKDARRFIGSCLKDWEEGYVADALRAAESAKGDPKGYVRKILGQKPKKSNSGMAVGLVA